MTTTSNATYDPADDKLRLRASSRLDAETYARVKAAGFGWPRHGRGYLTGHSLIRALMSGQH